MLVIIIIIGFLAVVTMGVIIAVVVFFNRRGDTTTQPGLRQEEGGITMQFNRLLIIVGVILGLITIGSAICLFGGGFSLLLGRPNYATLPSQPDVWEPTRIPTVQVIVALQPIARGSKFVAGSIGRRDWPANNIPPDVIADEAETIGMRTKMEIVQGQVIVHSMLTDEIDLVNAPKVYAWCDIETKATLVYSFTTTARPAETPYIILGSSGGVRLKETDKENQAALICTRDGFGSVTVKFVDLNTEGETKTLYSCLLSLECQGEEMTVTASSPIVTGH